VDQVTWSSFPGRQGESFHVDAGGGSVELVLVRVDGPVAQPGGGGSLSALFEGPRHGPLTQGTYDVDHAQLGRFPLFLVPVGIEGGALRYQAVFTWLAIP
jgi:hypothetical protein